MIELRNVNKTYLINKHKIEALKNINLTVKRGEIVGVLGKSGAGKSTLLRCVNLLERPTSGQVFVNQIELTALPIAELRAQRHKIGIIFQHFNLLASRTAFDNIALPLEILHVPKREIEKKVTALLKLVDLADKRDYLPSQLSGGQKQRVAIARALAAEPHVLLSDEATSALDTESTQSILKLLKKINEEFGLSILLITHELEVVKQICHRVGVIHRGELIEQDTAINVLANPKHVVTQQLVRQICDFTISPTENLHSYILRLTFIGDDSDEPLISSLAKKFDITINIRQARIEKIQDTTVGFTICQLTGQHNELANALQYIQSTSIRAEVINYG